ncbi:family 16 glycoside hydrolase [Maribellus sediminis]|uniref:family 16 glycoside hydrolase n=1 Tax=Maribellus sediminis TaxID=2696285 RepID=UPI00142FA26C|nr:family 16 glycoside hydrolase [Maribellus sediminis]
MTRIHLIIPIVLVLFTTNLFAQLVKPELPGASDKQEWVVYNREIACIMAELGKIESILLNSNEGDGLVVYQNLEFENGTIEVDLKGKDVLQRSFLGIAFHIQDENSYNAVYFRPFNFKKPERAGHSVQYISHPEFAWHKLRSDFPEQFENPVTPIPDPNDWFHAKIEVSWPNVKVYVDDAEEPSLAVKMKSAFQTGKVGFWVGNGSDGSFRNLTIVKK